MTRMFHRTLIAALAVHSACLAGDGIRLPALEEGEWTMSTIAITSDGKTFKTPEAVIACMQPAREMQKDLAQMEKRGCIAMPISSDEGQVRYKVSCPAHDQEMTVTLTASDPHSYRQFIVTPVGSNELRGRRLGPCKPATAKHVDRHAD